MINEIAETFGIWIGMSVLAVPLGAAAVWRQYGPIPLGSFLRGIIAVWVSFLLFVFGVLMSGAAQASASKVKALDIDEQHQSIAGARAARLSATLPAKKI